MAPIVIDSKDSFTKCLADAGSKLVVVDFTATWCGPCRMMSPKFEEFSQIYTGVVFLKVDVDDVSEVTEECTISSMPTFVFFKNEKEVERFSGANVVKLEEAIKKWGSSE